MIALTAHEIFLLIVAAAMFVGLPVFGLYAAWKWLSTDPKDRPERESGGGYMSNAIGGAMQGMDELIRPSAEHTVEAQTPVVKEDEQDGE